MRFVIKFFLILLGILLITVFQVSFSLFFKYPISSINILFVIILLLLLIHESGIVVWLAFITHFILELYTTSTPFGIILSAGTLSILLTYWLHKYVIINKTWYSGIVLAFISLTIYRAFYLFFLMLSQLVTQDSYAWRGDLFFHFAWEILLSSILVGLFFMVISFIWPSFKHSKVEKLSVLQW